MAKLIELNEAAKMLGITPDALTEMRSRNEIFGYRDGASWKFKQDEIERVAREKGLGGSAGGDDDASDDLDELIDLDLGDDDLSLDDLSLDDDVIETPEGNDSDSILVSEQELGRSDENTASTIIGEADDLLLPSAKSRAPEDSNVVGGMSDLDLGPAKSDSFSLSDVLAGDSTPKKPAAKAPPASPPPVPHSVLDDDDDELKLQSDSGSLDLALGSGALGGSKIELVDDDKASSSGFGSAIDLGLDDDELVLGSGAGSDITSGAGDSGINLTNPADSGLSLEDPMELSASSSGDSLELGEDELLSVDDDLAALSDGADNDFQLTPVDSLGDDESDSGSQVISLDDADFQEENAGDLLADEDAFQDADAGGFDEEDAGVAAAPAAASLAAAKAAAAEGNEGGLWNVLLFGIVLVMGIASLLALDVVNNIWSWQGTYAVNSSIMDAIIGMLP